MPKVNLIIDGNYILNKDTYILFKLKTLYSELDTALKVEVDRLSNLFPFDNVYFVADARRSWRKDFYKEYKGKRKKDEKIDWEFVYKTYDEYKERIKEQPNITFSEFKHTEGDDIIAHIIKESNKLGYSNLVIASDGDLHQLLDYSLVNNWINIMYNNKITDERVYLPENYKVFVDYLEENDGEEYDIFNLPDEDELFELINKVTASSKKIEVNKEKSLFIKLVWGDRGDNIDSVYQSWTKTGKIKNLGEKSAEKIYDLYKETYPEDIEFISEKFVQRLSEVVCYFKDIDKKEIEESKKKIQNKIKRNIKLMMLNEKCFPKYIKEQFNEGLTIK